jgi:3-phosphoshikimate 1-carboxyvinyltransferase
MIEIAPRRLGRHIVRVPGSKSYTHRMLVAAALADGPSRLQNCLESRDTALTRRALEQMGVGVQAAGTDLRITGTAGRLKSCPEPIWLENSGTSMRLLTAVVCLGRGTYTLTGTPRLCQRPLGALAEGLARLGASVRCRGVGGYPPVEVVGGTLTGGEVALDCSVSSQFLSAVLLAAPYTRRGVDVCVAGGPVSRPYVDITVEVMERFGVPVERSGYERFSVSGDRCYRAGSYSVEPDGSQAGYFWAAAAITGGTVTVAGLVPDSRQGDLGFTRVLEDMGCRVHRGPEGIGISGPARRAVTVDMGDMPDLVPTLAVVAAFVEGRTVIGNAAHLRAKESDRLAVVVTELRKMGVGAEVTADGLAVTGGGAHGAEIETYDDHRIAMSFALAGLAVPGVKIRNPHCVEKSFPSFWKVFGALTPLRFLERTVNP